MVKLPVIVYNMSTKSDVIGEAIYVRLNSKLQQKKNVQPDTFARLRCSEPNQKTMTTTRLSKV
jgi:hypothetical protein